MTDMQFDRSVSDELMDMLRTGPGQDLVQLAKNQSSNKPLYDLQLRREPKGKNPVSWATLYYGLTALLNVRERGGQYQLTADKSYRALDEFDESWTGWNSRDQIENSWPQVLEYLQAVPSRVDPKYTTKEGPVHAAISSGSSDAYRVINREASPSFKNEAVKKRRRAAWIEPFNQVLAAREGAPKWWPANVTVGNSLDFLTVDIGGRLALIEAKADKASAGEIAKVAVQVGVYAAMYADLLRQDPDALLAVDRMLEQRTRLGLSRKGVLHLRDERRVVPVIAIGPSRPSTEVHRRMWEVASAVADAHGPNVDPIEVWYLDAAGRITEVERAEDLRGQRVS